jgi:DNA segregation ATPase FtsK/SpoIIIE-like protein
MSKRKDELEQIKTDLVSLKIQVKRIEYFLRQFPNIDDYLQEIEPSEFSGSDDELLDTATKIVSMYDRASASLLQRRLSIGYARASRLIDLLEKKGVIGPSDGSSTPREVLINKTSKK